LFPETAPDGACTEVAPPPGGALRIDFSFVDRTSSEYADFIAFANRTDESDAGVLAWAYAITGDASYCGRAVPIVDGWMHDPGQIAQSGYIYVDDYLATMSMVRSWCPNVSAAQKTLWAQIANSTLDAMWGRGCDGWGVCDLFNNYHNHFVRASVYWGIASGDPARLAFGRQKFDEQLSALAAVLPDGGSREGMGYFYAVKHLNDTAMVLHDSGYGDAFNANHYLTGSALVYVHGTTPDLAHFAPIGSQTQGSDAPLNDYRRGFVGEASHQTNDASAKRQMDWWLTHIFQDVYRANTWDNLWTYPETQTPPPLVYKAARVGVFGRTAWSSDAAYAVTVIGDRSQSHSHAEQGEVMVWKNGWLTVPGHTFSHSGITDEASKSGRAKNVIGFYKGGAEQIQGEGPPAECGYTENQATGDYTLCLDLTALYAPTAGVSQWKRVTQFAGGVATVTDSVQLSGSSTTATQQWIVGTQPTCTAGGCTAGNARFEFINPTGTPTVTPLPSLDSDFETGWRISRPCNGGCETKVFGAP
jgi:hypothetical protein